VLRGVTFDLDSGRFAIAALGEKAFVQAVHGEDPEQIIDIVAWSAMRPCRFGTFLGNAGLLGSDAVLNPASFLRGEPCPIWATPIAWLQSGLRGCVILNSALAAETIAQAPGKFQCEDEHHARWLVESHTISVEKLLVPRRNAA
jgi:hypothetical protein